MSNIIRGISSRNNTGSTVTNLANNTNLNTDIIDKYAYTTESFSNIFSQSMTNLYSSRARNTPLGISSSISNGNSSATSNSINNKDNVINSTIPENNYVNIEDDSFIETEFRIEIKAKDSATKNRISDAVTRASKEYDIDPNLILAVIQTESNFNPSAKSKAGAVGLMQIMPSNFKHLGIKNGYDIEENIMGGTKLLKEYIKRYEGNIEMALMAYNGGPTRMANRGVKSINDIYKMPKETQNYVSKVMSIYRG